MAKCYELFFHTFTVFFRFEFYDTHFLHGIKCVGIQSYFNDNDLYALTLTVIKIQLDNRQDFMSYK